jgi:hypothetical protein
VFIGSAIPDLPDATEKCRIADNRVLEGLNKNVAVFSVLVAAP